MKKYRVMLKSQPNISYAFSDIGSAELKAVDLVTEQGEHPENVSVIVEDITPGKEHVIKSYTIDGRIDGIVLANFKMNKEN